MVAAMVTRTRLKSILTGLALYTVAGLLVSYFGVNAYTGKYGLNARQELDQEIIALTSELVRAPQAWAAGPAPSAPTAAGSTRPRACSARRRTIRRPPSWTTGFRASPTW